jgi:hypothetical protein
MAFCSHWFWSGRSGGTCRLFKSKLEPTILLEGAVSGSKGCIMPPPPITLVDPLPEVIKEVTIDEAEKERSGPLLDATMLLPIGKSEAVEGSGEEALEALEA